MIKEVFIDKIVVNPHQPRHKFKEEELNELAKSIRAVGIIHPPVVRPQGDQYELVSGERRLRAAKLAGLDKIPVVVHEGTRSFSAQAALIENIQRVDLNPIEIARALKKLIDEFGYQHDELADRVGKKRATVSNYLRLLSLPKSIQDALASEEISMGHAKAVLSAEGFQKQLKLFEMIVEDELSVREAEKMAQKLNEEKRTETVKPVEKDIFLQSLQESLQTALGTKVSIQGSGKKGSITIDYYDLEDLDRLLQIFGVHETC